MFAFSGCSIYTPDSEKKNGKKITEIIKSFGNIDEIVLKEIET